MRVFNISKELIVLKVDVEFGRVTNYIFEGMIKEMERRWKIVFTKYYRQHCILNILYLGTSICSVDQNKKKRMYVIGSVVKKL